MDSRERIQKLIAREKADRPGFWLGNPHPETWENLFRYFGISSQEAIRQKLHDDFRWLPCMDYRHPYGLGFFEIPGKVAHGQAGPLAECTDPEQLDQMMEWPSADYVDYDRCLEQLRAAGPHYRASGMWTPFYHHLMDLLGMENYMMFMYERPEVVQAVTDRVCSFYFEANARLFEKAGDEMDGFFFGNDFGTQLDLICSPDSFDTFILPWFKKFTDQGHAHGYQVILHSCGAISRIIDRLIHLGVDCLHPLQAKARNMEAEKLAARFKGRIAFMGGIDTQELLVHGTAEEIRADVRRVRQLLHPDLILSPSHEALLPNVSPESIVALAEESTGKKVA